MIEPAMVSIGLAVYNGESFIARAIDSVQKQSYPHWELIIVNDGSIDKTANIISEYREQRIKLINNPKNLGVTPSRNKYLQAANGKYIAIIDADDEWHETKLEKQVHFLETHPDHALCGAYAYRTNGNAGYNWQYPVNDSDIRISLLWGSAIIHSSILIRKCILEKHQIFYDARQVQAEDYKLICECIKHGKAHNIPEVLLHYHEHDEQLTCRKDEQILHSVNVAWYYITNIANIRLNKLYFQTFKQLFVYKDTIDTEALNQMANMLSELLNNKTHWFNKQKLRKSIAARFYIACSFKSPKLKTLWHYTQKGLLYKKQFIKILLKKTIKCY